MALLELENVSKHYGRATHRRLALESVSLALAEGELVAVWGARRSGRSTLLRVAAGIDLPDTGTIRYWHPQAGDSHRALLGSRVAYCRTSFSAREGSTVGDHIMCGLEALGVPRTTGTACMHEALRATGVPGCATRRPEELNGEERARVHIARALATDPWLLVIDEPTLGVEISARDAILDLLRRVADEGRAVLMSTGDTTCLTGADRALTLQSGALRGELAPTVGNLVQLRPARQPAA